MSNVNINQATQRIKQARARLTSGINEAVKSGAETPAFRTGSTATRVIEDYQQRNQAISSKRRESVREDRRQDRSGSGRGHSYFGNSNQMVPLTGPTTGLNKLNAQRSLNTKIGKPFPSLAVAPKHPEKLFHSAEHETEPPVATASSINSMPPLAPREEVSVSTKYGPGVRYSGTEYLTTITTSSVALAAPARGEVLFALPISPSIIPDTRLSLATAMYTRYIFRKIRFYYLPTAPTTTPGSLLMYADYDPSQNPSVNLGEGALRYAFTHRAAESSVWQRSYTEVNDAVYADMLYCDPDEELRWSVQGCFWVLSSGALGANLELGKIVMEYEIDFAIPDYRGIITNPVSGAYSLDISCSAAGAVLAGTLTPALDPGAYFLRLDNQTLGTAPTVFASANTYQQGVPGFPFTKGLGCFMIVTGSGSGVVRFILTPDLYSLAAADNLAIRCGIVITAGTRTYNCQVYSLERVAND